jgi:hypothetical protein
MNADDPLDAALNAWEVSETGDITPQVMERVEREALLSEVRGLRSEMAAMHREIAALRAELAAMCRESSVASATSATINKRGQHLLPFALPTDTPTLLLG